MRPVADSLIASMSDNKPLPRVTISTLLTMSVGALQGYALQMQELVQGGTPDTLVGQKRKMLVAEEQTQSMDVMLDVTTVLVAGTTAAATSAASGSGGGVPPSLGMEAPIAKRAAVEYMSFACLGKALPDLDTNLSDKAARQLQLIICKHPDVLPHLLDRWPSGGKPGVGPRLLNHPSAQVAGAAQAVLAGVLQASSEQGIDWPAVFTAEEQPDLLRKLYEASLRGQVAWGKVEASMRLPGVPSALDAVKAILKKKDAAARERVTSKATEAADAVRNLLQDALDILTADAKAGTLADPSTLDATAAGNLAEECQKELKQSGDVQDEVQALARELGEMGQLNGMLKASIQQLATTCRELYYFGDASKDSKRLAALRTLPAHTALGVVVASLNCASDALKLDPNDAHLGRLKVKVLRNAYLTLTERMMAVCEMLRAPGCYPLAISAAASHAAARIAACLHVMRRGLLIQDQCQAPLMALQQDALLGLHDCLQADKLAIYNGDPGLLPHIEGLRAALPAEVKGVLDPVNKARRDASRTLRKGGHLSGFMQLHEQLPAEQSGGGGDKAGQQAGEEPAAVKLLREAGKKSGSRARLDCIMKGIQTGGPEVLGGLLSLYAPPEVHSALRQVAQAGFAPNMAELSQFPRHWQQMSFLQRFLFDEDAALGLYRLTDYLLAGMQSTVAKTRKVEQALLFTRSVMPLTEVLFVLHDLRMTPPQASGGLEATRQVVGKLREQVSVWVREDERLPEDQQAFQEVRELLHQRQERAEQAIANTRIAFQAMTLSAGAPSATAQDIAAGGQLTVEEAQKLLARGTAPDATDADQAVLAVLLG